MPISIPYTASQTPTTLTLTATFPTLPDRMGLNPKTLDLYITPQYLKLNAPPCLLQVDLYGSIDLTHSLLPHPRTVYKGNTLELTLIKNADSEGLWPTVALPVPTASTKQQMLQQRQLSITAYIQWQEQHAKALQSPSKAMNDRLQRINSELEQQQKARISQLKGQERVMTMNELYGWKHGAGSGRGTPSKSKAAETDEKENVVDNSQPSAGSSTIKPQIPLLPLDKALEADIDAAAQTVTTTLDKLQLNGSSATAAPPPQPAIRPTSIISVDFTPNVSQHQVARNAPTAIALDQASHSQHHIQQLLQSVQPLQSSAQKFESHSDWSSAINVYAEVVQQLQPYSGSPTVADQLIEAYHQRCICQLQRAATVQVTDRGNHSQQQRPCFYAAVDDCSSALRLVEQYQLTHRQHLHLLSRRAAAYMMLGNVQASARDYGSALQLAHDQLHQLGAAEMTGTEATPHHYSQCPLQECSPRTHAHHLRTPSSNQQLEQLTESIAALRFQLSTAHRMTELQSQQQQDLQLKQQGDLMLQNECYTDALTLYNESLSINPVRITTLANKAACHLQLQQYTECLYDCHLALTLIDELKAGLLDAEAQNLTDSQQTQSLHSQLLARRGSTYAQLQDYQSALTDLKQAYAVQTQLKQAATKHHALDTDRSGLQRDIQLMEYYVTLQKLQHTAQQHYNNRRYASAVGAYTQAIQHCSSAATVDLWQLQQLLCDRSACHLQLEEYDSVIADCNKVDMLYEQYVEARTRRRKGDMTMRPSEQQEQVEVTAESKMRVLTLMRRGSAYAQLQRYADALEDLEQAWSLITGQNVHDAAVDDVTSPWLQAEECQKVLQDIHSLREVVA